MSILEALVSIAIAAGIFAGATEAWRSAIARSTLAREDMELALVAQTVLLEATSAATGSGVREGVTPSGVRWRVATSIPPERNGTPRLAAFEVDVERARGGPASTFQLATLKLLPGGAP